jgi:hypothetical protein
MGPASNENLKEKENKKKWRLSNLLSPGHKESNVALQPDMEPSSNDSAYGGSELNSTANSAQNVPTISNAEASAQGAPVKTETDQATGRIITTTTTTTTTTVTTVGGDHYQVPAGSEVVVTKDETSTHQTPTELSARPLSRELRDEQAQQVQQGPPIPNKNNRRSMSPRRAAAVLNTDQGVPSPIDTRPNFSYPSRTPPPHNSQIPTQQHHPQQHQGAGEVSLIPGQAQSLHQSGAPQLPQQTHDAFSPQIPARYGSATPVVPQHQYHQAYNPNAPTSPPPASQSGNRPRPPVDPSIGQPRVDGTPGNRQSYPGQRPGERLSTVQTLKTAAAGIHVSEKEPSSRSAG